MVRATSKASYRETKETNESTQSKKILEIIFTGGDWSLQELIAAYEVKWGVRIDSGVMSARRNKLLNADDPSIKLANPRKCSISNRTIDPVIENICTHELYKTKDYMMYSNAAKLFEKGEIKIIGTIVANCKECGADISHAKRVKIKKVKKEKEEAKQPTKKYNVVIRGKKSSMICYNGETIEEAEKECKLKFGEHFEGIRE